MPNNFTNAVQKLVQNNNLVFKYHDSECLFCYYKFGLLVFKKHLGEFESRTVKTRDVVEGFSAGQECKLNS